MVNIEQRNQSKEQETSFDVESQLPLPLLYNTAGARRINDKRDRDANADTHSLCLVWGLLFIHGFYFTFTSGKSYKNFSQCPFKMPCKYYLPLIAVWLMLMNVFLDAKKFLYAAKVNKSF